VSPSEETFAPPYPAALERFPTLRQSLLQSFNNCALTSFFDAEYRRGWSQPWQARGQMFHRIAAECLREMARLGEESIPVDAALSIMRDLLRQDEVDRECPHCGAGVRPGMDRFHQRVCERGHRFETDFINLPIDEVKDLFWVVIKWANENTFDTARLVDVEHRLKAEVRYPHPMGGTVPRVLTGKLDAAILEESEDGMVVIDWKDTWGMPPETEVSFEGYFQQRFYAALIFANWPSITRVTLREFYARFSATREATVTRADEPELHSELSALAERFDRAWSERLFPASPGKHCNYCIRPGACPIPEFARGDGRVIDEAVAEDLARQLIVGEQVVKGARAALRAYSEVHGPIPVRDAKGRRALGFVERESTLRPSLEDLEKAERLKGGPLNPAELRELYRKRRETRFTHFTPEDVDEAELEEEVRRQLEASIEAAREAREAREAAAVEPAGDVVELDSRRTE
jgi:PD-(D/E)XK nuclease superfamily